LRLAPDAPRVLAGFLVSFDGNALGQSWVIHQGTNLLGRLGASAGADIELPHATVSSRHATIAAAAHPGRMFLQDHGSTNGSYVNDAPLQPQQQHPLKDGDRVRLGLFNLIVKIV
jgi:pSer/pThr/pTyr-binding forkhead associated (FHA) protein